jgi:SSS family solute:Na+ symporter
MGYTFLMTIGVIALVSYMQHKGADDKKGIPITKELFKTSPLFNIGAFSVFLIVAAIYAAFWN